MTDEKPDKRPGQPVENEFHMKIAADGRWFHEGGEIKRLSLVRLFASVLSCDETGQHWLRTPAEFGRIDVEDAAFIITEMTVSSEAGCQIIQMQDNLERTYQVGADYELYLKADEGGMMRPYLSLDKGVSARLSHPVYYQLAECAETEPDQGRLGVYSQGIFFSLE